MLWKRWCLHLPHLCYVIMVVKVDDAGAFKSGACVIVQDRRSWNIFSFYKFSFNKLTFNLLFTVCCGFNTLFCMTGAIGTVNEFDLFDLFAFFTHFISLLFCSAAISCRQGRCSPSTFCFLPSDGRFNWMYQASSHHKLLLRRQLVPVRVSLCVPLRSPNCVCPKQIAKST